jgi:hypothetical protein
LYWNNFATQIDESIAGQTQARRFKKKSHKKHCDKQNDNIADWIHCLNVYTCEPDEETFFVEPLHFVPARLNFVRGSLRIHFLPVLRAIV